MKHSMMIFGLLFSFGSVFVPKLFSEETTHRDPISNTRLDEADFEESFYTPLNPITQPARPPQPTHQLQDLEYPKNFLAPSRPNKSPASPTDEAKLNPQPPQTSASPPASETPAPSEKLSDKLSLKKATHDQCLFWAVLVSGGLLGCFLYLDHRYRCWLGEMLEYNSRLVSSTSRSEDFIGVMLPEKGLFDVSSPFDSINSPLGSRSSDLNFSHDLFEKVNPLDKGYRAAAEPNETFVTSDSPSPSTNASDTEWNKTSAAFARHPEEFYTASQE